MIDLTAITCIMPLIARSSPMSVRPGDHSRFVVCYAGPPSTAVHIVEPVLLVKRRPGTSRGAFSYRSVLNISSGTPTASTWRQIERQWGSS
jgi:hypothetical protein